MKCLVYSKRIQINKASLQHKIIPNSIEKHKSFLYSDIKWEGRAKARTLLIRVLPRWAPNGIAPAVANEARQKGCDRYDGKKQITNSFEWFLASWAKKMRWKDVADTFNSSLDTVFRTRKF